MKNGSTWTLGLLAVTIPAGIAAVVVLGPAELRQAAAELPAAELRYRSLGLPVTSADLPFAKLAPSENGAIQLKRILEPLNRSAYLKDLESSLTTEDPVLIREALEPFQIALEDLPGLLTKKGVVHQRNWDDPNNVLFPELAPMKTLVKVLMAQARLHTLEGKPNLALRDLNLSFQFSELLRDEPTLISCLVQIALHSIRYRTYEYCLAAWKDQPEVLDRALAQIERERPDIRFMNAMKTEAFMGVTMARRVRSFRPANPMTTESGSQESLEKRLDMEPEIKKSGPPNSLVGRAFMTRTMQYWSQIFEFEKTHPNDIMALGDHMEVLSNQLANRTEPSYAFLKEFSPIFNQATLAVVRCEAGRLLTAELARALAVRARTGEFPKASTVKDPFSKQPFRVKTNGSEFQIYSFGTNRVDDGGWNRTKTSPISQTDDAAVYPPRIGKDTS